MQKSDALLCSISDSINADILNVKNRRATMVANFGVGYNNIDVEAAEQQGIAVSNTPGVLTEATADIALMLILATTRRTFSGESMLRAGDWSGFSITNDLGVSIQNKTLGIIGMGQIGRAVARRAVLGFGMNVIYYNRSPIDESKLDFTAKASDNIATVMANADIVSLHIPGVIGKGPVITEQLIAEMKPSAFIVNTARGDVIDEPALIQALINGRIAGAGLDVYKQEPYVPNELISLDNVTLLPHIGSATQEVRDAMGMLAVDNLVAHFGDNRYPSRVV